MSLGRDGIAGLICLAISLVCLYFSFGLPQLPLVPVGPGFYPRIVLVFMAALSVILIAQDIASRRTASNAGSGGASAAGRGAYHLVSLVFAVFGLYVVALPLLGYRIATALFVAAMQATIEQPRDVRGWGVLVVIAVAASAATYVVFDTYLTVLLPRGAWTDW